MRKVKTQKAESSFNQSNGSMSSAADHNTTSLKANAFSNCLTSIFHEAIANFSALPQSMISSDNRIISRNANGTIAMTSQPTNESELQLYRVLQRSNLLSYYDIFICQGGDDVQQLCEAGEEEFLEIMALVGMASKPLHVRRLQKALQEWMSNPGLFQTSLIPNFSSSSGPTSSHPLSTTPIPVPVSSVPFVGCPLVNRKSPVNLSSHSSPIALSHLSSSPLTNCINNRSHSTPSPNGTKDHSSVLSINNVNHLNNQSIINNLINPGGSNGSIPSISSFSNEYGQPVSPLSLTPTLVEAQINRLAEAAERLVKNLPSMDPKLASNKKRITKELEYVMSLTDEDPTRMDEIRKYAAIYGRFDCKRKPEKPLTLHEVSVNEAAAQICKHIPALLTRRDELFPLARQVVRDSGYQYSKGHSRSQCCARSLDITLGLTSDSSSNHSYYSNNKRVRVGDVHIETKIQLNEDEKKRRQDRLENLVDQLKTLGSQQEELKVQLQQARDVQNYSHMSHVQTELESLSSQQMQLINEQSELNKQLQKLEKYQTGLSQTFNHNHNSDEKVETDDTESQISIYSNTSSPSPSQEARIDSADRDSAKKIENRQTSGQVNRELVQDAMFNEGVGVIKELANSSKKEAKSVIDLSKSTNKVADNGQLKSSGNNFTVINSLVNCQMTNQSDHCTSKGQRTNKAWAKDSMMLSSFSGQLNHNSFLTPMSDSSVKDSSNLDNQDNITSEGFSTVQPKIKSEIVKSMPISNKQIKTDVSVYKN